jgi:hypothetical protein
MVIFKMSTDIIELEGYRFWNFRSGDNLVTFDVMPLFGRNLKKEELEEVEAILDDLGKWENTIKAGLHLFSELKLVNYMPGDFALNDKPFGSKFYETAVNQVNDKTLEVNVRLIQDERCIRDQRMKEPLSVTELHDQLSNVGKWRVLRKAVADLKIKE